MEIFDRQNLETLTFPFTANQEIPIPHNGNYFKYVSGTGSISVHTDKGLNIILDVGGAVKCSEFTLVRVQDQSGASDTKKFTLGYGEIKDNSVSGTIDVDTLGSITDTVIITPEKLSLNENCFIGYGESGEIASQFGHVYLFNPVSSGKNIVLKQIRTQNRFTAYSFFLVIHNIMTSLTEVSTAQLSNKNIGSTLGIAEIYQGCLSSALFSKKIDKFSINQFEPYTITFKDDVIITEGNGIGIMSDTAGVAGVARFEWEEIDI